MFKVLIPSVALLGLVAFAAQPATPGVDVQSDPAPMGWHLSHEGVVMKLAYGVANSDQLAMMMTCAPGDTQATVYGDVQPNSPALYRTANTGTTDPMLDEAFETRIDLTDPAISRLAERGRMRVESASGRHSLRADKDERTKVRAFVAHCAGTNV
jgi:hypothetical protein